MIRLLPFLLAALLVAPTGADTEQVYVALTTLRAATTGVEQVSSYVAHFCLTTQHAIREHKRGWYTLAQADYADLKRDLRSDDLSRFKDAFLAFESVFDHYDGN